MSMRPDVNDDESRMPSNVLVLAPTIGRRASEVCSELLHGQHGRNNGLLVTCLEPPAERLAAWTGHECGGTDDVTVVDVETAARSAARTGSAASLDAVVDTVSADADLVAVGETIDRHLERLSGDGETGVCVHSVTDLLQRADERGVFKLLEVLTSSVERTNAVAHYHMNPDVHDPETIRTFEVLFEDVVDLRTAGVGDE